MKRFRRAVDRVSRNYAYVAEDFFFHQHRCRGRRQAISLSEEETNFIQSSSSFLKNLFLFLLTPFCKVRKRRFNHLPVKLHWWALNSLNQKLLKEFVDFQENCYLDWMRMNSLPTGKRQLVQHANCSRIYRNTNFTYVFFYFATLIGLYGC